MSVMTENTQQVATPPAVGPCPGGDVVPSHHAHLVWESGQVILVVRWRSNNDGPWYAWAETADGKPVEGPYEMLADDARLFCGIAANLFDDQAMAMHVSQNTDTTMQELRASVVAQSRWTTAVAESVG